MRIIHLQIELEFAGEFRSYSISQQIYKALTGRQPYTIEEMLEPGVILRSPKRKQLVSWNTYSCSVVMESITNPEECFIKMEAILEIINKVAPMSKLSKRQLITYWILPTESYSFKSLEHKYRDALYTQQTIWKNVYDSSIITDIKVDELILHHQSGPMRTRQLRDDYTIFNLERTPRVFLFLWASIHSDKVIQYSPQDIHRFLTTAYKHCEHHSEVFEEIWRAIL